MLLDFETGSAGLQYVTDDAWIEDLGIRYMLGVDGLNLWLVALTALLFAASALWITLRPPASRPGLYAFHVGLAETAVLGAFLAQDLILFVLFFDLMLVPFYFLVGQWGGPDRVAATFKLVVYTLVGSLLMLAAAVATGVLAGTEARRDVLDRPAGGGAAGREHAEVAVRRLRARLPDQDARLPVPRLDAGRLPHDAAARARGLLRRAVQGRGLRLPAGRAARLPRRHAGLRHRRAAGRARLDPLRLGAGLHADQRAADPGLLLDRPARLHHAGHLRPRAGGRRPGRAAADGQPRPRRRAAVLHHPPARRAGGRLRGPPRHGRHREARARARRRCSSSSRWPRWPCPGRRTSSASS